MKNTISKELVFMSEVEDWLVINDIKDRRTSLDILANDNLTSYISEVKWVLSWKAPDLIQDFNEMINDFKSNKDKNLLTTNEMEEEIEK